MNGSVIHLESQMVKIGGIPYRYIGNGKLSGGTDPELARSLAIGGSVDECKMPPELSQYVILPEIVESGQSLSITNERDQPLIISLPTRQQITKPSLEEIETELPNVAKMPKDNC